MFTKIKEKVRGIPGLWSPLCRLRAVPLHRKYEALRERYFARVRENELPADSGPAGTIRTNARKVGDVHTLLIFRNTQWQNALLNELRLLGPVTVIDYHKDRIDRIIENEEPGWLDARERMHAEILNTIAAVHPVHPVDWVFCYFDGKFVLRKTIESIKSMFGVPTVQMCLDDKHYWDGPVKGGQRVGQIDLAEAFDLSWSSARTTVGWYRAENGRAVYMPEGFDPTEYYPTGVSCDIPVSFVGACYGVRPILVNTLRRFGIPVQVFGKGWGRLGNDHAPSTNEIFNRSQINLGCGYMGNSDRLTNVKGRDFEVPGAGGGVYLTTFNADLAQHFHIGREILCYHGFDECLELIRYYLGRPGECRRMAKLAREKAMKQHRWLHRYVEVCQYLGILDPSVAPGELVAPVFSENG